jgi:Spy/CpxP family protein refolding chaperone
MNAAVRQKAAIWLALVFLLGAATGGVFGYNMARRSYASTRMPALTDAQRVAKKVTEMTQEIGLDQEQANKAGTIILDAQTEIRGIRDKSEADVDLVRMKARDEMRAFLTPEQKAKFEDYVNRLDAERKKQKEAQGR